MTASHRSDQQYGGELPAAMCRYSPASSDDWQRLRQVRQVPTKLMYDRLEPLSAVAIAIIMFVASLKDQARFRIKSVAKLP
jgi:hypothetical protein